MTQHNIMITQYIHYFEAHSQSTCSKDLVDEMYKSPTSTRKDTWAEVQRCPRTLKAPAQTRELCRRPSGQHKHARICFINICIYMQRSNHSYMYVCKYYVYVDPVAGSGVKTLLSHRSASICQSKSKEGLNALIESIFVRVNNSRS